MITHKGWPVLVLLIIWDLSRTIGLLSHKRPIRANGFLFYGILPVNIAIILLNSPPFYTDERAM